MRVAFAIAWHLIGLLTWYCFAFAGKGWYDYWYLWDKGNFVFLFIALSYPIEKEYRSIFKVMAVFAAIRFIWEIISLSTGLNVNNTKVVAGLFIFLTGSIIVITFKELLKWRKQSLRY